jgi:RNA polymerase sigma-70 factor, ECF subfamily
MKNQHDFQTVWAELYPAVWAHCHRLLGSASDADDATQEVFLAVYEGLDSFRGDCKLFTWVYRIATRIALRYRAKLRRQRREPAIEPTTSEPRVFEHEVRHALATLNLEHATVLSLFAVEGLSHSEIADILGIPEGTVWSRLHTARKKLAQQLDRS